jgi:hypothetical protein
MFRWRRDSVGMSATVDGGDGNDGSTKSGRLVTNDGHQRRSTVGTIGLTPVTNYGVSTKIAHMGFLNRITQTLK